jgi:hypothetical protein
MRRTLPSVIAFLAMAVSPAALGSPKADPVSKLEVRYLPQRLATQRILRQVGDLLRPGSPLREDNRRAAVLNLLGVVAEDPDTVTPRMAAAADGDTIDDALDRLAELAVFVPDPAAGRHPHYPLHEYTLERPYRATAYAGLCVVDDVTALFDPVGGIEGAATAVRAADIDIRHYYHRLAPIPAARVPAKASAVDRAATARDCAKLVFESDGDRFFSAANAADAAQGLWLADAIQAAARGGGTAFPFACPAKDLCLKRLSDPREALVSVQHCPPPADASAPSALATTAST